MLVLKEFSNIQQVRSLIQGILGMRYRVLWKDAAKKTFAGQD